MGKSNGNSMILVGVMMALMVYSLLMEFGSTWPAWAVVSCVLVIPVVFLMIYRPSIAKDVWDAIGDKIRGSDDEKKKEEPKNDTAPGA